MRMTPAGVDDCLTSAPREVDALVDTIFPTMIKIVEKRRSESLVEANYTQYHLV